MNSLQFASTAERNWKLNLEDMGSFKPKYTFYSDFSIADFFQSSGLQKNAIIDTYERVIKSWGNNYEAMTEVVLVLNHKIWSYYQKVDSSYLNMSDDMAKSLAVLYNELWEKAERFFFEKFEGNEKAISYYYEVTD